MRSSLNFGLPLLGASSRLAVTDFQSYKKEIYTRCNSKSFNMEYPSICSIIGTLILVYIISPIQCNQKIYLTRCTDGAVRYEGYRSGTIVSQQRGLNYTTGIDCKVIIGVPEGYYIRLRFSKFEVQEPQDGNCLDFVRVFEGQTTQWKPLSSKLCGNIMPPAIMSSSNYVTIWWKTDNTQGNSLPGWQVEFKRRRGYTVERRHCLHCNSSDETSSCFANTTTVKSMKCPAGKPHCYSLARYINNTGEFLGEVGQVDKPNPYTEEEGTIEQYGDQGELMPK
ncbi:unnamed protein product [Owenia fusiformis]|uniref:Uncharacterized protein n=1 Tax=Owenia fusiformis TaxID=6347 RepID=A0A8J1US96_OWEFU|nr:unnamed protein product [Owenia fusiformis]